MPVRSGGEEGGLRHRLRRNGQPGHLHGERHPDLLCQTLPSIAGRRGKRLCETGACEGEGLHDGRVVVTQKKHYSLRRIETGKKETELLYIFFRIHIANTARLAEKRLEGWQIETV